MPGTVIKSGAVVEYAIVGESCTVESGVSIGASPETVENRDNWGIAVIGHGQNITEGTKVLPKQMVPDIR